MILGNAFWYLYVAFHLLISALISESNLNKLFITLIWIERYNTFLCVTKKISPIHF